MANRRMLSRSISTSRRLNRVSDSAALLFSWTLPHLDDFGNMEGGIEVLRGTIVPLRNWPLSKVEKCKSELCDVKAWQNYKVDGELYIHCDKFEDYQTFKNDRGRIAEYPQPSESTGIQGNPPESYKRSKEKGSEESENGIPFSEFWNLYPKKVEKRKSEEKWNRLPKGTQELILKDLPRRKLTDQWKRGFILNPMTYLNGERWNDELPGTAAPPQKPKCKSCGKESSSWIQVRGELLCQECSEIPVNPKLKELKVGLMNKATPIPKP